MWSVGCIFAELMGKRPVFMCHDENEVLTKVFYMLGSPSETFCSHLMSLPKYRHGLWGECGQPGNMREMYADVDNKAFDLL